MIKQEITHIVLDYLSIKGKEKGFEFGEKDVLINLTPADFTGDYTIVLFPFIKKLGMKPEELAEELANHIQLKSSSYKAHNLVKGFLNIELTEEYWTAGLQKVLANKRFGFNPEGSKKKGIMVEYPSPNTNKPLHLGHLRNIFLGASLSKILQANGYTVYQTCLYNDRGTNISKSMLMYLKSENKLTPENSNKKPDKLVGDYYVEYGKELKKELDRIIDEKGLAEKFKDKDQISTEAKKYSQLEKEVAELTIQWELKIPEVRKLWETMNGWFYKGVKETFKKLDVKFDKEYFESEVYHLGRETVQEGLTKGIFNQKEDTSVWIDLTDIGLDQKLVLRANGTTVYITQDIALVYQKQKDFDFEQSVYVVGNEQEYHFKVLFEILKRLGLKGAEKLFHLSYGMVELPDGKMKTREGTVVEADDILEEVITIAKDKANEQGKLAEISDSEKEKIYESIGIGALRYFLLKVDPVKRLVYKPEDSIDFVGNTAPFIQYIHARTQSLKRNAVAQKIEILDYDIAIQTYKPNLSETKLIRTINEFPTVIAEAGENYSPALIANYVYQVAAEFSTFYHDFKVLKEEEIGARSFRFHLSQKVGTIISDALHLLCIDAPERM